MNKKIFKRICIVILIIILLFPIKSVMQDGGSVEYRAILYKITKFHRLNIDREKPEVEYIEGISIKVLGIEIYNNTEL